MSRKTIYEAAAERILVLDGALGTMVQSYALSEEDFRGAHFGRHCCSLRGCNDVLVLTRPDVIRGIHERYLAAGADIISTDSFNANRLSLADYGLADSAYEISRRAAELAREAADRFTAADPSKPRFVAGSAGPGNKSSSIVSDIDRPEHRETSFAEIVSACTGQIEGLIDGGADLLLFETVFDTLNAKAMLWAAEEVMTRKGRRLPVMVSATPADSSGRLLSGQSVEAFCTSVAHAGLFSVGLNCSFGADKLMPFLERLSETAETLVSAHPNAGLPNLDGSYDETPEQFVRTVEKYLDRGLVNIIGGCCGTTPEHIALLSQAAKRYSPRRLPEPSRITRLSGLDELRITPEINFVNIGERTNVAGSAKFARMIREGDFEGAVSVARAQVEAGAQIIDICMDDGLIDGPTAMSRYLAMAGADPEISRVPVMIDSSSWEVLEAGLRMVQGKCIVNSLSLKEGPETFLERARAIRRYGAAVVVMLFDERGQADTFERKCEVAARAYRLLVEEGFPPEDIVFDPNVLTVATGIPEHDRYASAFIEAVRWIKRNLPFAKVSGGISNLSFAFRGNNAVREAMHSVFLHHAVEAGMDMGIVNPQMLVPYELIEPELAARTEDLILCRRDDAAQRLAELAQRQTASAGEVRTPNGEWRNGTAAERIACAMQRGIADFIEEDTVEAAAASERPADVIDTVLMPAMEHIGELFGAGKMFLPQVIKSASVMKRAISVLAPMMSEGAVGRKAGRVVLATVKGDVHDIGKNIVAVIAACNGFEVFDLGVSAEASRIIDEAVRTDADAICLSGLITPSLEEMRRVCEEAERRGVRTPIIVGGAATSEIHTSVRIAPVYSGIVVNARNASENSRLLTRLAGREREECGRMIANRQRQLREEFERESGSRLRPLSECRARRRRKPLSEVAVPKRTGLMLFPDVPVSEVEPLIDWNFFFSSWEVKGRIPEIFDDPQRGAEARRIYDDARRLLSRIGDEKLLTLQAAACILPAVSRGDDIVLTDEQGRENVLPMLRNQSREGSNPSLADFVAEEGDYVGCFALTAGVGLAELCGKLRGEGREYEAVTAKLLADRLTEALAEWLHRRIRREEWGYESGEPLTREEILRGDYRGKRMAFGYPASPDHSLKRTVFDLLDVEARTAMRLTDNFMISPGEALCGLIFSDAEYFSAGRIDSVQLADYAERCGTDAETVRRLLPYNTAE
ncbi:MAG: methionine synthase [Alistipes sp.]|nr:methionine synthase [Alistipes sp.]